MQEERSPCFLCDQVVDTVDHILLQCVSARQVWYMCFDRMGIDMTLCPSAQDSIGRWWPVVRKRMPKLHRKGFDSVVISVCWNLYMEATQWKGIWQNGLAEHKRHSGPDLARTRDVD